MLRSFAAPTKPVARAVFGVNSQQAYRTSRRISAVTMASTKKAVWEGKVVAEADASTTKIVENNVYFPPSALKKEYFEDSDHKTTCGWKGTCSYYTLVVDGKKNPNAAWYYPACKDAAKEIEGYVAFWKGVKVE